MSKNCPNNNVDLCSITRGDTWEGFTFEILNEQSQPISIADVTDVLIQFKRNPLQSTADFQYRLSTGTIVLVGTEFKMTPLLMNFPVGLYHYDVQLTYVSGAIRTIFKGTISITQDVSRL